MAILPFILLFLVVGCTSLTVGVAVQRRNIAAIVNGVLALSLVVVSIGLVSDIATPRGSGFVSPELPLWVALASLLHSIGMLGWYESVWWWDHLTHTVSAMLIGALFYAGILIVDPIAFVNDGSSLSLALLTIGSTLAVGIFWELIELLARAIGDRFDIEPLLVHYGWRDTAFDLVFDLVGAILVVTFDIRLFVPLAEHHREVIDEIFRWTGGVVLFGSVVIALLLGIRGDTDSYRN